MLESKSSRNLNTEDAAASLQNDYSKSSDYEAVGGFAFEKAAKSSSVTLGPNRRYGVTTYFCPTICYLCLSPLRSRA